MRLFYLIGSAVFTVLIVVLAFENIVSTCNGIMIFFTPLASDSSPTFLIFGFSVLGVLTGFFYHGLIMSLFKEDEDEEE